jgi:PAS domain S-box-containing protein
VPDEALLGKESDILTRRGELGGISRALFEQSPFSTVIYDPEGHPLALNKAFTDLWGVTLEMVPAGYSILSDPELEAQGVIGQIRRAFEGETIVTPPIRYDMSKIATTGAGRTIWTQGHFFPVRDRGGKLRNIVLKHIDLTAQMTIEEELRASEERLRLATSAAGIGTWDYNVQTDVLLWDVRAKRAFGLPDDSPSNDEVFRKIVHPADAARVDKAIARAMSGADNGAYDIEYRTLGLDGVVRWVHATGRVLFDGEEDEKRPVRFIGIIADISERVSLLEAERRARAEAEEARERAEEANRAKSDFLAKMSHELRTPLNAIGGHAELIELGVHGAVTPEQVNALERIRKNERHLLALINDILDFSKLEAGAVRLEIKPIRLSDIISSLDPLIAPLFNSKGVSFTIQSCDDSTDVIGDTERVIQICLNLLSNALKATQEGGEVVVSCEIRDDEAAIKVSDTGSGIPAERLESVFSPFTQLGRTLSSPETGVGLGLAISRELARAMGGDVTVTSELGKGSVFVLTLRRA